MSLSRKQVDQQVARVERALKSEREVRALLTWLLIASVSVRT